MKTLYLSIFVLLASIHSQAATPPFGFVPCSDEPKIQHRRSEELQRLYSEDQSDYRREMEDHPDHPLDMEKLEKMAVNDLKRRKRVGEILGEGCFQKSPDYIAAATIFQHGNSPDHFFQAFLWAKQAVGLGDSANKALVAKTIDRYLTKSGHKQLFGTQAEKSTLNKCFCLDAVESAFPDSKRQEYLGKRLSDMEKWLKSLNGANDCPNVYCDADLISSPQGTVVGFW
jgi:hypothetical protein